METSVKIAKITTKSWQSYSIKSRAYYTFYKTQHLALTTIIKCSARLLSVKFNHCRALSKVYWQT